MNLRLTDFRLAGFLVSRGHQVAKHEVNVRGEVTLIFSNEDDVASNTINSFPGSAEQRYDSSCKTMYNFVQAVKRSQGEKNC
jgi:hypothetical protein